MVAPNLCQPAKNNKKRTFLMHKVIFDTDPGVDDAMALLFLHHHHEIDLVGITTVFGNALNNTLTGNVGGADYLVGREIVPIARPDDGRGPFALHSPEDLLQRPLLFHTNYPDNWERWFAAAGCPHGPLQPAAGLRRCLLRL